MGEGKKQKLTLFITSFVSESQTPVFVIWNFCSWSYMEALVKWIATHRVNGNSKGWIGSLRMDTGRNTCTCVGPLAHQWFNQQSDHLLSCEMQFMSFLSDELWWLNPKVTQWTATVEMEYLGRNSVMPFLSKDAQSTVVLGVHMA